jgi:hypothetical protein
MKRYKWGSKCRYFPVLAQRLLPIRDIVGELINMMGGRAESQVVVVDKLFRPHIEIEVIAGYL